MRRNKIISARKTRQAGISLTEAILGITTLGVGLGVIAQIQTDNLENIRQEAAAQQMKTALGAAKGFVRDYYGPLVEGCTAPDCPAGTRTAGGITVSMPAGIFSAGGLAAGNTIEIGADALFVAGYIDAGQLEQRTHPVTGVANQWLLKRNSYGSDVLLTLTNTGPAPGVVAADRLRLQLVTRGGTKLSDKKGATVASKIGPDGGFRPADESLASEARLGSAVYDANNVYGAFGNWNIATADMGGANFEPDTGGLAAVAYFGEGGVVADFLYRNAVPGQPEAQQMNANINANNFGIGSVRQIGAENPGATGGANGSNPNVLDTNTAPAAITATFGSQPADPGLPGVDANRNVTGNAGAPTADNTVRFGNPLPSQMDVAVLGGNTARYDRGNANIQVNDIISRNVDSAGALRGLQQVEAGDRQNTVANRSQRFGLYSGFDNTGVAATTPRVEGYDNTNVLRSQETFTGTGVAGTGTARMIDGLNQERSRNEYNGVAGNLTLKDDTNRDRVRAGYTAANAGDITLRDGVGVAPGTQRFTTAYAAAAGNLTLNDDTGAVRADTRYTAPDVGNQTMRQATGGVERYRNEYTAVDGRTRLRDNAGTSRQEANYGANTGNIDQYDLSGDNRSRTSYNGTDGEHTLRDDNGLMRARTEYNAASTISTLVDAAGSTRVQTNSGSGVFASTMEMNQPNGTNKIRLDSGVNNTEAAVRLRQPNGTDKIRLRSGDNTGAAQVEMIDDANQRRIWMHAGAVGTATSTFVQLSNAAGQTLASLTGSNGADAGLEIGDAGVTTDRVRLERAGAGDVTNVNLVLADNQGTGVINSDGSADAFRVAVDGAGTSRLRVESDGAIGINTDGPDARLDINCNAGDPNCVLWRNNGTSTMNHLSSANGGAGYTRLGAYAGASPSPLGAGLSVLDVDDVFLRSRGIWLSEATRFRVVDVAILGNGGVVGGGVPVGCANTVAVVSPNSWASPVPRTRIRADGTDIGGSAYTAVRTYTTHLGGTSWRVNIEGRGRSFDEGGGALGDSGWQGITDARATVTVYCYN